MDQNKCYNSVSTSVVPPDKKKEYDNDRVFPSLEFSSFNFFHLSLGCWILVVGHHFTKLLQKNYLQIFIQFDKFWILSFFVDLLWEFPILIQIISLENRLNL